MPKTISFDGKSIIEPGAYSRVIGGVAQSQFAPETGTVLLIDTGLGAGYGGGSGFDGAGDSGLSSIYEFETFDDFARWNRGGAVNEIAYNVFNPSPTRPGTQKLMYVKAAETTAASLSLSLASGVVSATTVAEGPGANGVLEAGNLETGFAVKIVAGIVNTSKFKLQLYRGVYQGANAEGDLYGGGKKGAKPELVAESREVATIAELSEWAKSNPSVNGYLASINVTGTGAIVAADVTGWVAFNGGTETYTSQVATDLVKELGEVDFNFVMVLENGGSNATSTINTQLFTLLNEGSLDMKFLVVAGGESTADFDQDNNSSFSAAEYYDSSQVFVWHGGYQKTRPEGGFRSFSSLHGAALYVGLIAGLDPQEPGTFKPLDVDRPTHELSRRSREAALKAGVVHLTNVRSRGWSVNQDVTTLQDNDQQVYPSGDSPEGSIMRIIAALNRVIRQTTELEFVGKSRADANPATIQTYVEARLKDNTANAGSTGLILKAFEVSAAFNNGDVFVEYKFIPNGPVNRIFITGTMLNVALD